ncbi:hypothetical protein [Turneriella parva]|uniref:Uncharacterized protein n=1 Tax=Turneriella parva (strain ATCC BAA-1111 / DSM 21527 / NCTC 11395 / H) TaxID=869212 RepID=I4B0D5_TURPD|nr:hypothetical protein [Turneriella parva]AFM10742.1 hypothetical protein Turpa_0080 [Turneriella parva DSM 21527]
MQGWKRNNIKTTVSLPAGFVALFGVWQKAWLRALDACLADTLSSKACRDRARCYNHARDKYEIVPVYWPVEVYNKLHALAAAQRVSVSSLVYSMIVRMLSRAEPGRTTGFNNYSMKVKKWSKTGIHVEENINFRPQAKEKDHPPLAA